MNEVDFKQGLKDFEEKADVQIDKVEDLAKRIAAAIEKWYVEHMHNSVVSRDTEVHNHIQAAKPALVAAVVEAVQSKE